MLTNRDLARFLDSKRVTSLHPAAIRSEFYREEFIKHWRCLDRLREYYSERTFADVRDALGKLIAQVDQLCAQKDADQVVSRLLRKIDGVTRLSAWTDPKHVH